MAARSWKAEKAGKPAAPRISGAQRASSRDRRSSSPEASARAWAPSEMSVETMSWYVGMGTRIL